MFRCCMEFIEAWHKSIQNPVVPAVLTCRCLYVQNIKLHAPDLPLCSLCVRVSVSVLPPAQRVLAFAAYACGLASPV